MHHSSIGPFLEIAGQNHGPIALVFAEDALQIDATLAHLHRLGFGLIGLFAAPELTLPPLPQPESATRPVAVHRIDWQTSREGAVPHAVNRVIGAAPGRWLHYCYNSEYLYFPFSESRNIRDLLAFQTEERRDSLLTYVVDLYAEDLQQHPSGVCPPEAAWLDGAGYFALARLAAPSGHPKERQLDFFGGLRWRFEEHVPANRRRIDRIGLFRAVPGLRLLEDHRFNIEEFNTYACPWHNNITAAICSFRTAKALRANPGSRAGIHNFRWRGSRPFAQHSQQLMDLGLMEPGQWF